MEVVFDENPCVPSPCGPNSVCQNVNSRPVCSCVPNYYGRPPNCRPECTTNSECPPSLACINERCKDPCIGSCGWNAECRVVSHSPKCYCTVGFEGDPYTGCREIVPRKQIIIINSSTLQLPCFMSNCNFHYITLIVMYSACK